MLKSLSSINPNWIPKTPVRLREIKCIILSEGTEIFQSSPVTDLAFYLDVLQGIDLISSFS